MKKFLSVLFIFLCSSVFTQCFADECHDSVDGGPVKSQTLLMVNSARTINVQPDAVVSVWPITSYDTGSNAQYYHITCDSTIVFKISALAVDSGYKNSYGCAIYKTPVRGIGFVVSFSSIANCKIAGPGATWSQNVKKIDDSSRPVVKMELYIIGQPESGVLDGGAFAKETLVNINQTIVSVTFGGPVTINVAGCSMTSNNISIPLGDVPVGQFTAPGTTAGEHDFTVGFKCNVGINAPSVSLEGTQSAETGDRTVLALTDAGREDTATGVGVQIISGYTLTPLTLDGDNVSLNYPVTKGQTQNYEFKARYYQTRETVTPGIANATATLNITYQ